MQKKLLSDKIFVLDFGGQYTQLITKAVRKCKVFSDIKSCDYDMNNMLKERPRGIILSGGPASVYEKGAPAVNPGLFRLGIPILGICYGMQLTNQLLGGGILQKDDAAKEYGETTVVVDNTHPLFSGLKNKITVWMSHGDSVDGKKIADGFRKIGNTENHVAAIADDKRKIYGVQFHPEVTHTPDGLAVISNFVHRICGCKSEWTMENYIEQSKEYVRDMIGKNDVICFVSGGVDSSFVAALLAQTEGIGRVYPVYIGALMRKEENDDVRKSLAAAGVKNLLFYEAEDRFIDALEGVSDPERKRKIIGNIFVGLQQEICEELRLDSNKTYLAQGTLYTDLIESGKGAGKKADTIKSHHNVGCEFIEKLRAKGMIVEPNRLIFKDEVRQAARDIGLPPEITERQPFPGPGLGIRIVAGLPGCINEEFYEINKKVKSIALKEGLEGYALPVKTVGVQGDKRTYSYLGLLRGERNWKKIRAAANKITSQIPQVNRLVYDIDRQPIGRECIDNTIPTTVTRETVDLLKELDFEGRKIIGAHGFGKNISQTIFILFGADISGSKKRSVALRAVLTDDFMTVSPIEPLEKEGKYPSRMTWACLDELRESFLSTGRVGAFVIDVTDKPPATTCWE